MSFIKSLCLVILTLVCGPASADPLKARGSINTIIEGYNQSCHAEQSELPRIDRRNATNLTNMMDLLKANTKMLA